MRCSLSTAAALLLGCNASLAQVSTMGTTAMGIPTTPGVIVTSPLTGPGPFSATTQPGTPVTTLAPVPLASNPATPGTFVTCATPIPQLVSASPVVPVPSMSAMGGTVGTMPSISAATTTPSTAMMPSTAMTTGSPLGPFSRQSASARSGPYRQCRRSAVHQPSYAAIFLEARQPLARLCRSQLPKFRAAPLLARFNRRPRRLPIPASIRPCPSYRRQPRQPAAKASV